MNKIKPGIYTLAQNVDNPCKIDRRKSSWDHNPQWVAGTRFIISKHEDTSILYLGGEGVPSLNPEASELQKGGPDGLCKCPVPSPRKGSPDLT